MALREIDQSGRAHDVDCLEYPHKFDRVWQTLEEHERAAIEAEINGRLDRLRDTPDAQWGSITNTSIEGGRMNSTTGIRGDWTDTVFQPIFYACGKNEKRAGMFYGSVWKKIIIERPERWIGIRADPTFPERGITLQGKTYFLDRKSERR